MSEGQTLSWQKTVSALLILAFGVSVPLLTIMWDRVGAEDTTYFTGQNLRASGSTQKLQAFDVSAGVSELSGLPDDEKQYLMKLLFQCLDKGTDKGPASMSPPPGRCSMEAATPVFVTVYGPRGERFRVRGRQRTPAACVQEAASKLRDKKAFGPDGIPVRELRARIDIVTGALPLSSSQRKLFERTGPVQPAGVALAGPKESVFFLSADVVDNGIAAPAAMVRRLKDRAETREEPARASDWPVSRVEAVSFANTGPGAHQCMDTPRGLPIHGEVTRKQIVRACRGAADFLARTQARNGSFAPVCRVRPGSLVGSNPAGRDAAIVYSLARYYGFSGEKNLRQVCMRGLARLFRLAYKEKGESAAAYIREKTEGRTDVSLGTTALALCAFCEFRRAADEKSFDDLIERMGDFLRRMQKQNGSFAMRYLPEKGKPRNTKVSTAQRRIESAQAALGLTIVYRELRKPRFLLAARNALSDMEKVYDTRNTGSPAGVVWYALALREMFSALPAGTYVKCVSRIGKQARDRQIGSQDSLWAGFTGAAAGPYPPETGPTARDLRLALTAEELTSVAESEEYTRQQGRRSYLGAAREYARFLMQMQITPRTGYFLPRRSPGFGGFLEESGGPVVNSASVRLALDALTHLATRLKTETKSPK